VKIIFGTYSISRNVTGISNLMQNLCKSYSRLDHEIFIAATYDEFSEIDMKKYSNQNIFLIKSVKIINPIISFFKYFNFYRKSHADIAHIHSLWSVSTIAIYLWARIYDKPYLISPNGMLSEWALNQSKLKKSVSLSLIFRRIIKNAFAIIVNSKEEVSFLKDKGYKNKFYVIPNGVDLPLKSIENKNNGPKTLLFLSRIHQKKGIDLLIEAWKEVSVLAEKKNWHLNIVGFSYDKDNIFEKKILNILAKNKDLSNVTVSKAIFGESMWDRYYKCNSFILPTFSEGSSIAILNAWASGKLCLTTEGANLKYGFNDLCTIKIKPTVESIKNGLLHLFNLSYKEIYDRGLVGKEVVSKHYLWKDIADTYLEIYKVLLKNKER
jgi:glycosyltransferase involved in cell wall biosynthesis